MCIRDSFVYYGNSSSGGSQRLRINSNGRISLSGNTTNNAPNAPDGNLHIQDSSAGTVTADSDADELTLESNANTGMSILSPGTGESSIYFGNPGTNGQKDGWIKYYHETHSTTANRRNLVFTTATNERLRITSGVVASFGNSSPPAWANDTGYYNIQLGKTGFLRADTDTSNTFMTIGQNAYKDSGGWKYAQNGGASSIFQQNGVFVFESAGSGTAGNALSLTEKLRIDSSGNMGLGTGSGIDRQFHIQGSAPIIKLEDTGGGYSEISANTAVLSLRADQGNTQSSSYINFQVDGGEKVRITSAGLVGINETSPEEQLHITHASAPGIQLEATAGGPYKSLIKMGGNDMEIRGSSGQMEFYTGNADGDSSTKRLTITSGGDIESANSVQSGGNATSGFKIGSADTAAYMSVQSKSVSNGGSTSNAAFQAWLGASNTFRVNANGLIKTNAGIDFSGAQTNYSGMSSEVLDSYEEGTFTPSINGMGSISYSLQAGKYTKIGNTVFFQIRFNLSSRTAGSHAHITNMPFTASTATIQYAQCTVYAIQGLHCSSNHHPIGQFQSSEIYLYQVGYQSSSNYSNIDENQIDGTAQFGVYGFYYTAS